MENELINKVIQWGRDKGITDPKAQMTKVIEEFSELNSAAFQNDEPEIIDALGDLQVTLIILMDTVDGKLKEDKVGFADMILPHVLSNINVINYYMYMNNYVMYMNNYVAVEQLINETMGLIKQYAEIQGYDAMECLQVAYDVISKRTGKNVNGVFVKDE